MKKFILFIALSFYCLTQSQGQVLLGLFFGDKLNTDKLEFGLTVGLNSSNLTDISPSSFKTGLKLGSYFFVKFSERQYLRVELIAYSTYGAGEQDPYSLEDPTLDQLLVDSEVETTLRYVEVPVLYRYRIYDYLFLEGGLKAGFMTNAFDEFMKEQTNDQRLIYRVSNREQYTRLDFGFMGGLSYKLLQGDGIGLSLFYYEGLVELKNNIRNRSFQFGVSIPVGKAKANE